MDDPVVEELLDLYSLEDLFDVLEIEPQLVLRILLDGGHVVLPQFLIRDEYYDGFGDTREET